MPSLVQILHCLPATHTHAHLPRPTQIYIATISGFMAALAGVILAARMTSGQPMTSVGFEFFG